MVTLKHAPFSLVSTLEINLDFHTHTIDLCIFSCCGAIANPSDRYCAALALTSIHLEKCVLPIHPQFG